MYRGLWLHGHPTPSDDLVGDAPGFFGAGTSLIEAREAQVIQFLKPDS
jgi:hypothetical protein